MKRITEADIAGAFADEPAAVIDEDSLDRAGKAAIQELVRRFEDPATAKEMPGTGLLQFGTTYLKETAARREAERRQQEGDEGDDVIDILAQSGLPEERKREVLADEIARLEARVVELRRLLEGE